MAFISRSVHELLQNAHVRVFFVSGAVTKWYNAQRRDKHTEVALLGGWYWTLGKDENGPFRTASGAQRDAYYRVIRQVAPPILDERDVARALRDIAHPPPRKPKRQRQLAAST